MKNGRIFLVTFLCGCLLSSCATPTENIESNTSLAIEDVMLDESVSLSYQGTLYNKKDFMYLAEEQVIALKLLGKTGKDFQAKGLAKNTPVYQYRESLLIWCGHRTALVLSPEITEDELVPLLCWEGNLYAGDLNIQDITPDTLKEKSSLGVTGNSQHGKVPFLSGHTSDLPAGCPIYAYGDHLLVVLNTAATEGREYHKATQAQLSGYVQETLSEPSITDIEPLLYVQGELYRLSDTQIYTSKDIKNFTLLGHTGSSTTGRSEPSIDWQTRGIASGTPVYQAGTDLLLWNNDNVYVRFIKVT